MRTAATIASTYAILEIAGVGTALVLLETPLKLAKDQFRTALSIIGNEDPEKACEANQPPHT